MKTECFVPIKANSERVPGKILENLMESAGQAEKPYMHIVNKYEAVDINTEEHLLIAECIGNIIYNKYIKKDINYEKGINNRWSRIYRK